MESPDGDLELNVNLCFTITIASRAFFFSFCDCLIFFAFYSIHCVFTSLFGPFFRQKFPFAINFSPEFSACIWIFIDSTKRYQMPFHIHEHVCVFVCHGIPINSIKHLFNLQKETQI